MSKTDSKKQALTPAPFIVTFLAGGLSGTIGAIITCPLEVVKTRLQSSDYKQVVAQRASMMSHVRETMSLVVGVGRSEGLGALWRGVGATMVGVIPSRALHFSTYTYAKKHFTALNGNTENAWIHLGSAVTAGITVATITNPIWMLKTRLQLSHGKESNWRMIKKIVGEEGLRGMYRGMTASYLGVVEGTMQWLMYEQIKGSLLQGDDKDKKLHVGLFGAAAVSKFIAAIIAYPHEVLRTRLREDKKRYVGLFNTLRFIVREEGVRALYGGMTAHLLRVVPNSAIMFFAYEAMVHGYKRYFMEPPALLIEDQE